MKINKIFLSIAVSVLFFIICFLTLKDYGVSWDSATHFKRGQAYLHFFMTGQKEYANLTLKNRSFYQSDVQNGNFWLKDTKGHPPFNGIASSFLNHVFFQKLGILPDVESHNLFIVVTSSLLVFFVFLLVYENFGVFPAMMATILLVTYPLFWSESHFNIKDPPMTAFFTGSIYFFDKFMRDKRTKWIICSSILFGLALSIKLNALFLPIIFSIVIFLKRKELNNKSKYIKPLLVGLVVSFTIFLLFWPALWNNFPASLFEVLRFYKEVGTGTNYQPVNYYLFGFNSYPWLWVLYTTPPILLGLFIVGIYFLLKNIKKLNTFYLLLLIWFFVPLLRASLPGMSIYGGIRQFMEFLPAMVIIAVIGINFLTTKYQVKSNVTKTLFGVLLFGLLLIPISRMYPNENLYFNFLIGGLKGASEKNLPSWGNSFGNTYRQGIDWVNLNLPQNSKLTLLQGELINAPKIWLRDDINYNKENYSGNLAMGEYIMELTFDNTIKSPLEVWKYVETLPVVYEVSVDQVPVLRIWLNRKD